MATAAAEQELCEIIRAAATMVPEASSLVHRCRTEEQPRQELAVACGRVAPAYFVLRERVRDLASTPQTKHAEQLLNFQQQILEQASMLAFRPRDGHWQDLARRFGEDTSAPAEELLRLCQEAT